MYNKCYWIIVQNKIKKLNISLHLITATTWFDAIALRNVRWRDIDSVFYYEKTRKFEINELYQLKKIFCAYLCLKYELLEITIFKVNRHYESCLHFLQCCVTKLKTLYPITLLRLKDSVWVSYFKNIFLVFERFKVCLFFILTPFLPGH